MRNDSAGITVGGRRTLAAVLGAGMACAVALLALAGGTSGAAGKDEGGNPLAGKYKGTNNQGYPVEFKVSEGGKVLGFSSMVNLTNRDGFPGLCPNPVYGFTTTSSSPITMIKRTDFYPKGKKFDFRGPNGTGVGEVHISGQASSKGMSGQVDGNRVGTPGNFCDSDSSAWTAKQK